MRTVFLLLSLAACGAPAEDEPSCATLSERLGALEADELGRGLSPADRRMMLEALARHRAGGVVTAACASWSPAQRACVARAATLAEAGACGGGLVAVSAAPTFDTPPLPAPSLPAVTP